MITEWPGVNTDTARTRGGGSYERNEENNVKMNLKSVAMMVSTMVVISSSRISSPGSRDDQQMREVVRFIAEVQDFMARRGLLPEKSRSLIGGHIPCAANTIRGLLGSCRHHVTVKRRHSALHGLKALLAKRKKQKPSNEISTTTTQTEITTEQPVTESVTEPVTIIPGLDAFEELSVNSSVTSIDPGQGSVPTSTIISVISPFTKAISAVTEAISRITASVSSSFSSSDISGEQSESQATEEGTMTTGTPEVWETNTTLQSDLYININAVKSETVALTNENNTNMTSDVVVTKIYEMLQNELSNETMPQQSSIISGSLRLNKHPLSHELELEAADEAEDTTDSSPTIQEDDPDTGMRGRTDQPEAEHSETQSFHNSLPSI